MISIETYRVGHSTFCTTVFYVFSARWGYYCRSASSLGFGSRKKSIRFIKYLPRDLLVRTKPDHGWVYAVRITSALGSLVLEPLSPSSQTSPYFLEQSRSWKAFETLCLFIWIFTFRLSFCSNWEVKFSWLEHPKELSARGGVIRGSVPLTRKGWCLLRCLSITHKDLTTS